MIGRIQGVLEAQDGERVLLMTAAGVGYEVLVPARTLAALPSLGATVSLQVHTHVREDAIVLFGFHAEEDRIAFRILQDVNGVGPKLALAIVGSSDPHDVASAIEREDARSLARIPGIGPKTAARMVLELRGKLAQALLGRVGTSTPRAAAGAAPAVEDARAALAALGYNPKEVDRAIAVAAPTPDDTVQTLLRRALKGLSRA
jgi:Holliday junction DNA helicase RuvA